MYENKKIYESSPFKRDGVDISDSRTIYYGEVISIDDSTDGGRIKIRIPGIDNKIANENLAYAYPMQSKFFHVYPKIGEVVRIYFEDIKYPQRGRFWIGSIISQPHKINYDSIYTALSTTNMGITKPDKAPSTYPDAEGIYPKLDEIAILGRLNNDIILRENDIELRVGKHEPNNNLKLNKKNPASIRLTFQQNKNSEDYTSYNILMADKIALISHSGVPKIKSALLTDNDRVDLFNNAHPLARADILVKILEIYRNALLTHLHPHSTLKADKSNIILDLENINLESILQKNIVIN